MTLESQIAELLRKPWLRPGEAMLVLGVTARTLRAIREARPDVAARFPGMGHWRYRGAVVVEMLKGVAAQQPDADSRQRGDPPSRP